MSDARWRHAVAERLIASDLTPDIAVAPSDAFLSLIGMPGLVVQPMQPDHDRLLGAGYSVAPNICTAGHPIDTIYLRLPRSRMLARDWVSRAMARLGGGGRLILDGDKTDGIDPLVKALRARIDGVQSVSKDHGRIAVATAGPDRLADWLADPSQVDGFMTAPGIFSADAVDPGSLALAGALPHGLKGAVADLGAGWGWLSAQILRHPTVTRLDLVEADHAAITAARLNVSDERARFHWADVTGWHPDIHYDAVVMNPPFHTGRTGTPDLGQAFIRAAASVLKPGGALWLVANRHLPYESTLDLRFREWREIGGVAAYKVVHASKPRQGERERRA